MYLRGHLAARRSRAARALRRRASAWSASDFSRAFSALALWMNSTRVRLFLKVPP